MSKWNKRTAALTALTLFAVPTSTLAADIGVHVDGQAQHYDVAPYLKDDRTLVPLRGIFESLGSTVKWDAATATITAVKGDRSVVLHLGSRTAMLNGKQVKLETAPEETHGRTMVPIRLITEALGADVKWDSVFNAVRITSADRVGSTLNLMLTREPETMDSTLVYDSNDMTVVQQIGEGLLRQGTDGQLVPGVASSWTVSGDGLTYTFRLRDDAKWSDGTKVTADDFDFAWQSALVPNSRSDYAFLLFEIKRAYDFSQGNAPLADVGIRAIDDSTLQVTLAKPQPYFLQLLTEPVFYPQKRTFVNQAGDRYGKDADKSLSNGPFKLAGWNHQQSLRLVKNKQYWDQSHVALQQVNYIINHTVAAAETQFADGIIERMLLGRDNFANWSGHPGFSNVPRNGVFYLDFNLQGPKVLQNAKVRKALSYGLDVQSLLDVVYHNGSPIATALVPPGIKDEQGRDFREQGGDLMRRDLHASAAKTWLDEGLKELGLIEFPKLKLLDSDSLLGKQESEYIRELWRKNLGIDVEIESLPFATGLKRRIKHDYDISVAGWQGDYNDPLTFLDTYVTGNGFNDTGYTSQEYDRLLLQAKAEVNADKRNALLHQAEQLLVNDMPILPLYFTREASVTQPYIKGLYVYNHGAKYDLKYVYIEGKK